MLDALRLLWEYDPVETALLIARVAFYGTLAALLMVCGLLAIINDDEEEDILE